MYLPNFLLNAQYSILHQVLHIEQADGDDYFTIIARWVSNAWAALMAWLKDIFSAVVKWTHDTFPVFVAWLGNAFSSAAQPIKEHPQTIVIVSAFIFLGPQVLLFPLIIIQAIFLFLLTILGFGARGIVGGSLAANYQSLCYGGNTPASSTFAMLQSIGMKYHAVTLNNWVLASIRLIAGLIFVYAVLGMILWW